MELKVTYKWVMDGKYLEATFGDLTGKRVGTEIFGWDAADKAVKMWGFDTESIYEGVWTFEGSVAKFVGTSVLATGVREKGNIVITFGGDTMTAVGTKPGVKTPTFEGKFTKVKQAE